MKTLITILLISLGLIAFTSCQNAQEVQTITSTLPINNPAAVQTWLFIGVDSRNPQVEERSNSDMIMIMQINEKNVKIASIMRDTYVEIPGKGNHKINAAFNMGGEDLLIQTIYSNFSVVLKNYIIVDFVNAPEAIDTLGGVMVDVDANELAIVNKNLYEQNLTNPTKYPNLTETGNVLLNGGQALAYCRIRTVETGSDRGRTMRQQEVMASIMKNVQENFSISKMLTLNEKERNKQLNKILSLKKFFNSDMPYSAFLAMVQRFAEKKTTDSTIHLRPIVKTFPLPTFGLNKRINGVDYVVTDNHKMGKDLNYFLSDSKFGKYN